MKMAKILKAVASAFVAGALAATAMFSAVSADTTYTLTVNDTTEGHTYGAYQIFAGDLEGNVLSNIEWGNGIDSTKTDDLIAALKADSTIGADMAAVTDAASVAKVLEGYQDKSDELDAFAQVVGQYLADTPTNSAAVSGTTAEIANLPAGYYLVKDMNAVTGDDAATKFIIKIVKDTSATPKKSTPTVDKQVYDDDDSAEWNEVADYDIGDAVPFKLIGTMPSTLEDYETYTYIFHDTLSEGLTLVSTSIKVEIDGVEINSSLYTVNTDPTDGCTFEVSFDDIMSAASESSVTLTADSQVVVTYSATLNSNAVIGLNGNPNEVYLEYSNNPNQGGEGETGQTPEEYALVFTYELDVTKVDGENNTKVLEGAEFVLYDEDGNYVQIDENGKVTGWTTDETQASTLTSDSLGNFVVIGLDEGTYYLKETKAPSGYNLLSNTITVVIDATDVHDVEYTGSNETEELTALTIDVNGEGATAGSTTDGSISTKVENNQGSTLPETGGIGTTIFYVGGAIIVAGAVILLIVKRRMRTAE